MDVWHGMVVGTVSPPSDTYSCFIPKTQKNVLCEYEMRPMQRARAKLAKGKGILESSPPCYGSRSQNRILYSSRGRGELYL